MSSILFLGSNMNAQAAVIYLNIIDLAGASQLMDVETTQIITIKDLKNKIHATYGIAPDQQKLVLGNTKLEENQTLGYYGITDGLTVNILSLNTATDFSNFNTYTGSSATGVINLTEDMKATANINTQTSPNLEINGNGYTLDGNKALPTDTHGQFMGFNFNVGQALTLRNLTMKNFYGNAGDPLVAIHNNLGTLSIYDSIFSNNSGITRGAIYNIGAANIYNSTFTNNSSKNYGGAIHHASGILNIYNSEF